MLSFLTIFNTYLHYFVLQKNNHQNIFIVKLYNNVKIRNCQVSYQIKKLNDIKNSTFITDTWKKYFAENVL